jgi:protein-S-isoprenylcysteine O-methyltransferase Ste14
MYLGLLLVLAGWAAVLSHVLAFLFLPVFVAYINRFQITPEERVLSVKFGEAFAAYTQAVRKWTVSFALYRCSQQRQDDRA